MTVVDLDLARRVRAAQPAPTPPEEIPAALVGSTDGVWTYERIDDVLRVTYLPTGQARDYFDETLTDVLVDEIGTGNLLTWLRGYAVDTLAAPYTLDDDRLYAVAALHHFDMVDAVCVCGGYLTHGPDRTWLHLDVCLLCLHHHPDQCCTVAERAARHLMHAEPCPTPIPAQCEHAGSRRPNDLHARPCDHDKVCCGCCHGDNQ